MDKMSSPKWLLELGLEEPAGPALICRRQSRSSSDHSFNPQSSFSAENYSSGCKLDQKQQNQLMSAGTSCNSNCLVGAAAASFSCSSQIISFGSSEEYCPSATMKDQHNDDNCTLKQSRPKDYDTYGGRRRSVFHAQEHVKAERKRRENLNQLLLALSSLIPDLKKLDKASILAAATKHLKQLQEQVKKLEERTAKRTVESAVLVREPQCSLMDNYSSSSGKSFGRYLADPLPEIEARVSDKNVLIRIHCEKKKGTAVKIHDEIGKLHLNTVNSNVMLFGNHAMDITLVTQLKDDFRIAPKDVVKHLRQALQSFM
ncbi:hypothetical protein Ancab_003640 [Ancistrocladus abbreviatus]